MQKQEPQKKFSIADLPKRPKLSAYVDKYKTKILTNYYPISFNSKEMRFFQFQVTLEPEIPADSRWMIRSAVEAVSKEITNKLGYHIARGNIIWSFKTTEQVLTFKSKFSDKKTKQDFEYLVHLKKTTSFNLNSLKDGAERVIQLINSDIKKKCLALGMVELGRSSKFFMKDTINDNRVQDSDLKVWRGFMTSVHLLNGKPFLLVDFSSRVLRSETLLVYLRKMNNDQMQDLVGRSVICNYGNCKIYKIEGIDKSLNPMSTFSKNGKQITYKDYFKLTYNVEIKDLKQPLVKSSTKKHEIKNGKVEDIITIVYLIPQLLNMTGITDSERKDGKLMRNLAEFTKLNPDQRYQNNQNLLTNQFVQGGFYTINQAPSSIQGHLLRQPNFILKAGDVRPSNGKLDVRGKIFDPMVLENWTLVATSRDNRDDDEVDDFIETMMKACSAYGIVVKKPNIITPEESSDKAFEESIRNEVDKYGKPTVIVTFLTNKQSRLYPKLKRLLYVQLGIPHQNVLRQKVGDPKKKMSVVSKILLQINAKIGKPVWKIARQHPAFEGKKIIMGGMAIYHKLIDKSKSCEAFVGTTNNEFTSYYSSARLIPSKTERFTALEGMVIQWLRQYCTGTKSVPDYILIYRDGVGEGQIPSILELELQVIRRGVEKVAEKMKMPNFKPGIAFILCNKKINQRMFEQNSGQNKGYRGQGRGGKEEKVINPTSGTIIGSGISRYGFDFHLAAQFVESGTCTPTQFNVIHDTTGLPEDAFWTLTFQQCFNYYNWQGAVRVPAVLQYANKLSTLIGEHIKQQPNDKELSKKLYSL